MVSHRKHLSQSLGKVPKTQVQNYKTPLLQAPSARIGRIEAEEAFQRKHLFQSLGKVPKTQVQNYRTQLLRGIGRIEAEEAFQSSSPVYST